MSPHEMRYSQRTGHGDLLGLVAVSPALRWGKGVGLSLRYLVTETTERSRVRQNLRACFSRVDFFGTKQAVRCCEV